MCKLFSEQNLKNIFFFTKNNVIKSENVPIANIVHLNLRKRFLFGL